MSLLDAVAAVVDLAIDGDSLRLKLDVHCLLIVEYFDRIRSQVVATLSTTTSTCPSMKVDHHVLIFLEWWTVSVTCFVKFDVFPPQSLGCFWHSRHSLLEICQISDERCDLLSFVLTWTWLRQSYTANSGATKQQNSTTKRNPDKQSLHITLE